MWPADASRAVKNTHVLSAGSPTNRHIAEAKRNRANDRVGMPKPSLSKKQSFTKHLLETT